MTSIKFFVPGVPAPQGSVKSFTHPATGKIVSQPDNPRTKPWRGIVGMTALAALNDWSLSREPFVVVLRFVFPRPKSHFGSGRNAETLKASAPAQPCGRGVPDIDKLIRAVLDALTGVIWFDDSQVAYVEAMKRYGDSPGVWVDLHSYTPDSPGFSTPS